MARILVIRINRFSVGHQVNDVKAINVTGKLHDQDWSGREQHHRQCNHAEFVECPSSVHFSSFVHIPWNRCQYPKGQNHGNRNSDPHISQNYGDLCPERISQPGHPLQSQSSYITIDRSELIIEHITHDEQRNHIRNSKGNDQQCTPKLFPPNTGLVNKYGDEHTSNVSRRSSNNRPDQCPSQHSAEG
ncbi:hypothetical protein D3C78_1236020 [compost metagenome]